MRRIFNDVIYGNTWEVDFANQRRYLTRDYRSLVLHIDGDITHRSTHNPGHPQACWSVLFGTNSQWNLAAYIPPNHEQSLAVAELTAAIVAVQSALAVRNHGGGISQVVICTQSRGLFDLVCYSMGDDENEMESDNSRATGDLGDVASGFAHLD
ncbi:hypothetical protein ONS95_010636 [Cadophora gregata]|uniref:uncharacterized protein n=1 Tax=Cadophora gregata TaxID=51156 RepID=UPI0026DCF68D|nr:uncharacterized protein ONS95_010636 [Cadophora gregata]KAK0122397.1 hypothetical protein ONS95_010636 [Cadophora gregata]KAK0127876.1 hypothetical protein ONS96_007376 [Cadophora gregata f. sp. sojae]